MGQSTHHDTTGRRGQPEAVVLEGLASMWAHAALWFILGAPLLLAMILAYLGV